MWSRGFERGAENWILRKEFAFSRRMQWGRSSSFSSIDQQKPKPGGLKTWDRDWSYIPHVYFAPSLFFSLHPGQPSRLAGPNHLNQWPLEWKVTEDFQLLALFSAESAQTLASKRKGIWKAYKKAYEPSWTSNVRYKATFWWVKCEWIRNTGIKFPLKYT